MLIEISCIKIEYVKCYQHIRLWIFTFHYISYQAFVEGTKASSGVSVADFLPPPCLHNHNASMA